MKNYELGITNYELGARVSTSGPGTAERQLRLGETGTAERQLRLGGPGTAERQLRLPAPKGRTILTLGSSTAPKGRNIIARGFSPGKRRGRPPSLPALKGWNRSTAR